MYNPKRIDVINKMPVVRLEKCGHEFPNKTFVAIFSMIQKKHECPLCAARVVNKSGSEKKKGKVAKHIAACFIGTRMFRIGGDESETKRVRFEEEYTTFFAALPLDMLLLIAKELDDPEQIYRMFMEDVEMYRRFSGVIPDVFKRIMFDKAFLKAFPAIKHEKTYAERKTDMKKNTPAIMTYFKLESDLKAEYYIGNVIPFFRVMRYLRISRAPPTLEEEKKLEEASKFVTEELYKQTDPSIIEQLEKQREDISGRLKSMRDDINFYVIKKFEEARAKYDKIFDARGLKFIFAATIRIPNFLSTYGKNYSHIVSGRYDIDVLTAALYSGNVVAALELTTAAEKKDIAFDEVNLYLNGCIDAYMSAPKEYLNLMRIWEKIAKKIRKKPVFIYYGLSTLYVKSGDAEILEFLKDWEPPVNLDSKMAFRPQPETYFYEVTFCLKDIAKKYLGPGNRRYDAKIRTRIEEIVKYLTIDHDNLAKDAHVDLYRYRIE